MSEERAPYHPRRLPSALVLERASRIKLVCFDVDGTLTDGRIGFAGTDRVLFFNTKDGHGIRSLYDAGLEVAWITANHSECVGDRAKALRVKYLSQSDDDKQTTVARICTAGRPNARPIAAEEVAYMGDDENDVAAMLAAGLAVAPADAHPSALAAAHFVTEKNGGRGAARELCDLILAAQGK